MVGLTRVLHRRRVGAADRHRTDRYNAGAYVPQIVAIGITRELGPVIAGLMVAGRVAAAIAAEIGTMRVTEQIDALTTLATNPIKYLVVPRLIAAVISMPILVAIADSIGVFGGFLVSTQKLDFTGAIYLKNTIDFITTARCEFGPHQGGGVRLHHRADGLLQRLPFARRRAGRGCGDDGRGGVGVDPDPRRELRPHLGAVLQMTAKVELRGVKKRFGSKVVLDGLDLTIAQGESLVVIGGSGTGKSVMIKCVLGILKPDAGQILVDGKEVTRLSGRARDAVLRKFGMLFQGAALFDSLSVWENVAFGLVQGRGMARAKARDIAVEKLAKVGLGPEVANLSPSELSGGMQKRVGLARAIAADPEIIFFDEPTTGLDPIMADVINDLIIATVKDVGATALSITHDMVSARKIADRIAMLYRGKIIWEGPTAQIDSSGNPYVDQFIHGRAMARSRWRCGGSFILTRPYGGGGAKRRRGTSPAARCARPSPVRTGEDEEGRLTLVL